MTSFQILFFFHVVVFVVVILCKTDGTTVGTKCQGGRSIRGIVSLDEIQALNEKNNGVVLTASCCDSSHTCHGGIILPTSQFNEHHQQTNWPQLMREFVHHQTINADESSIHKRSIEDDDECRFNCFPTEVRCCPSNISVYLPISAISALSGERVHVVQAPPLVVQPVLFSRCVVERSSILEADCQQDFVPEMMHVIRLVDNMNGSQPELSVIQEPVLVESGCTCRLNPEPLITSDGQQTDNSMASLLNLFSK